MKKLLLIALFGSASAMAAPPVIAPGGLTPQQIIAHRQGVDIGARHTAAQSVAGSRSDEFAAINPGSSQARFLFNSTVLNSNNQNTTQPGLSSANNLSSAYIAYIEKSGGINSVDKVALNPFASKVEKSQVQGMVFLKSANETQIGLVPNVTKQSNNELQPKVSK